MDGDPDLLLSGLSGREIALIYSNDRDQELFTEIDPGLTGVSIGTAAWGDYDNDGDLDIALNGSSEGRIYKDLPEQRQLAEFASRHSG